VPCVGRRHGRGRDLAADLREPNRARPAVSCRHLARFLSLDEGWQPARFAHSRQNAWPSRRPSPSHLEG
jgi:hypothetical protein